MSFSDYCTCMYTQSTHTCKHHTHTPYTDTTHTLLCTKQIKANHCLYTALGMCRSPWDITIAQETDDIILFFSILSTSIEASRKLRQSWVQSWYSIFCTTALPRRALFVGAMCSHANVLLCGLLCVCVAGLGVAFKLHLMQPARELSLQFHWTALIQIFIKWLNMAEGRRHPV